MKHKTRCTQLVMDVAPYPSGRGFAGAAQWWEHITSYSDADKLDQILGLALLDHCFCSKLLRNLDRRLLEPFALTPDTSIWLQAQEAHTLQDLAQAVVRESAKFRQSRISRQQKNTSLPVHNPEIPGP